jgi:hypothetical protein
MTFREVKKTQKAAPKTPERVFEVSRNHRQTVSKERRWTTRRRRGGALQAEHVRAFA